MASRTLTCVRPPAQGKLRDLFRAVGSLVDPVSQKDAHATLVGCVMRAPTRWGGLCSRLHALSLSLFSSSIAGCAKRRPICLHEPTSAATANACWAGTRTRWRRGASCAGSSAAPEAKNRALDAAAGSRRESAGANHRPPGGTASHAVNGRRRAASGAIIAPNTAARIGAWPERDAQERH